MLAETAMPQNQRLDNLYPRASLHARIMMRAIKSHLGDTVFFQREDLLQLPIFTHISTISRYNHIRIAVLYLLESGALVQLTRTDLALPSRAHSYNAEAPLHVAYLDTIRSLVNRMNKRTTFSVMSIVNAWRTDGHLSENSKRIAVRHAMTQLVHDGVCKQRSDYEYMV